MKTTALLLAGLPATLALGIDMDDIPKACKPVCQPIGTLSDKCDVDLKSDIDRDEHRLTNQCICTNKSFDVGKFAALCEACVRQAEQMDGAHIDKGDLKDIASLVKMCGFASTSYNPSDSTAAASVTVAATAPTDISQLTTTIDNGQGGGVSTGTGGSATSAKQSLVTLTGENTSMVVTKSGSTTTAPSSSTSSGVAAAATGGAAAYIGAAVLAALAY